MEQMATLVLMFPVFVVFSGGLFGLPLGFLAVSVASIAWLSRAVVRNRLDPQYSPINFLLLLLGAAAFLSITSPFGNPVLKLYRAISFIYSRLAVAFLLVNLLRSYAQVRRAIYMFIGLAALSAIIALGQFWIYQQTGLNYSFAEGDQVFRITSQGVFLRATGLGTDPNQIASVLAVAAVWCLYLGLTAEGATRRARLAHYLLFVILAGGVAVTFSRSALLGFLIVCLIIPAVFQPSRIGRLVAIYGILGIGAVGTGTLQDFLESIGDPSEDVLLRLDLNQRGLQAILEYPVTGVGIDVFSEYNNPDELPVHNFFIQVASELGIPGLFFFLFIVGLLAVRLVTAAWQAKDVKVRSLFVTLTLGYALELLAHMGNPVLLDPSFWFYVGLSEAAVMVHRSSLAPRPTGLRACEGSNRDEGLAA